MNTANLTLNANPPQPPSTPSPAPTDNSSGSQRFDTAMDAARADASKAQRGDTAKGSKDQASSTTASAKPADTKSARKTGDDKAAKADKGTKDPKDTDTSVASAMLALIGVAPQAKTVATTKPADAASELAGNALGSLATTPQAALGADGVAQGAEQGALPGVVGMAPAGAVADAAATTAAPAFGALLAAQGGNVTASKDDPTAIDPLQSPMPALHATPADGQAMQVQATQPANSPQFAQELGEQIAWMGSGQVKEARIKLHPEELGSMDVRVNMDGGKVNVAIIAQHPAAVHAVQQTLSQLDSMLAHHGLSLGQADVGQRQAGQGDGNASATASPQGNGGSDADAAPATLATTAVSRGLLDEVA